MSCLLRGAQRVLTVLPVVTLTHNLLATECPTKPIDDELQSPLVTLSHALQARAGAGAVGAAGGVAARCGHGLGGRSPSCMVLGGAFALLLVINGRAAKCWYRMVPGSGAGAWSGQLSLGWASVQELRIPTQTRPTDRLD